MKWRYNSNQLDGFPFNMGMIERYFSCLFKRVAFTIGLISKSLADSGFSLLLKWKQGEILKSELCVGETDSESTKNAMINDRINGNT